MQPLESEIVRLESMNLQMLQTVQIEPEYYVIIQNPIHKIAVSKLCIYEWGYLTDLSNGMQFSI